MKSLKLSVMAICLLTGPAVMAMESKAVSKAASAAKAFKKALKDAVRDHYVQNSILPEALKTTTESSERRALENFAKIWQGRSEESSLEKVARLLTELSLGVDNKASKDFRKALKRALRASYAVNTIASAATMGREGAEFKAIVAYKAVWQKLYDAAQAEAVARFKLNVGIPTDVPEAKQDNKPDKVFRKALKVALRSNFVVTKVVPQARKSSKVPTIAWDARRPHEDHAKAINAFVDAAKAHAAKN